MNVLVTGGAGFIGSHLCERLLSDGNNVVCLDNFYTGKRRNIEHLVSHKGFSVEECDIRNLKDLKGILRKEPIDIIYHLAAVVGVKRTQENPELVMDVNINGTRNVFDAGIECKKIIFASSSEVYKDSGKFPFSETSPTGKRNPYAASKLFGEECCRSYHEKYKLKSTPLRIFNVYGHRQDPTPYGFVAGIFINSVLNNRSPVIFGNGEQTRDFTYIEDAINPMAILSRNIKQADGEIVNIGTGKGTKIAELAEAIACICKKNLRSEFSRKRESEVVYRVADVSKMKKLLGYEPRYTLLEGLRRTIQFQGECV